MELLDGRHMSQKVGGPVQLVHPLLLFFPILGHDGCVVKNRTIVQGGRVCLADIMAGARFEIGRIEWTG